MNTQHTPEKLFVSHDGDIRCPYSGHMPGISIARMTCYGTHDVHVAKEAIADRLVQCWNSHDALVSALESCLEWMEFTIPRLHTTPSGSIERMNYGGPISKARAALAIAKGGAQS